MNRMASHRAVFRRVVSWLCLSAVLAAAPGCQPQRLAQERLSYRARQSEWAAGTLAAREQRSAVLVDRDLRFLQERLELDAVRTERDMAELDRLIRRDIDRWNARQPAYRRELQRILRGKPEQIESTAIWLFY